MGLCGQLTVSGARPATWVRTQPRTLPGNWKTWDIIKDLSRARETLALLDREVANLHLDLKDFAGAQR